MNGLVSCVRESVSGARRAPTTASIEDDLGILRKFAHPLFKMTHRNVNGAWNGAAFLDLRRFADIDDDRLLLGFEFLSKLSNRYAFGGHTPDDTLLSP